YYGAHAYGIEAAAETYFSVPAGRLTLEQAALLAGLPQAPSLYDPLHNPAAALARRDAVLRALRATGDIDQAQYDAAIRDRSRHPWQLREFLQPRHERRAAGRLDVQADCPRRRHRAGHEPVGDAVPLGAVFLPAAALARDDVQREVRRPGDRRRGDPPVRQHR